MALTRLLPARKCGSRSSSNWLWPDGRQPARSKPEQSATRTLVEPVKTIIEPTVMKPGARFNPYSARRRSGNYAGMDKPGGLGENSYSTVLAGVPAGMRDLTKRILRSTTIRIVGVALGVVALDQLTKGLVLLYLGYGHEREVIDGFFRLGRKDQIRFQYLRSQTRYGEAVASASGQDQEGRTDIGNIAPQKR